MILEVQKINDQYVIKNPPISVDSHFFIQIEKKQIFENSPRKRRMTKIDLGLQELKTLASKFPDDVLVQNLLKYHKPHIESNQKSDDEVYHDYLMDRYGK